MHQRIRLLFKLLFFFPTTLIFAQQKVNVSGIVIDKDNAQPLPFVNIVLLNTIDSTIVTGILTDLDGIFRLSGVSKGVYLLRFKYIGYDEYFINLDMSNFEKQTELGVIELVPSSLTTDEVLIEIERPLMETSIDKTVYNVDQDLSSRGGTAEDVLQNVPSIEIDQDGNISLRGNANVIILIDGRPSTLSGGSRSAILNSIPAESIERIEIVTNPSAKYDPDGMTGIINIVLKKNKLRGLNGNLSVSRGSGSSNTTSLGLNYRTTKFNLYANYSNRNIQGFRNFYSYRERQLGDDLEIFDQVRIGRDFNTGNTLKAGLDYAIKEGHTIGVSMTNGQSYRSRLGLLSNEMTTNVSGTRSWYRNATEQTNTTSLDLNTNYQWVFKEKKGDLMFDFNYSRSRGRTLSDYDEYGFSSSEDGFYYTERFDNPENSGIVTASLDIVSRPMPDIQIEYGLKAIINSDEQTQYREIYDFSNGLYFPDLSINNEFRLEEQIYSAYGIFAHKLKKVHYQVGLRLEQALIRPELLTTNQQFKNDYFSFFPSVHVVFPLQEKMNLFVSYSRRISRPGSNSLNPFVEFTDPYNIRYGNPSLRPEYTNSFELGFNQEWEKITWNNTVYYRHSTDVLQRIVLFDELGRSAVTWDNLDQTINWGYEGIAIHKVTKWWKNVISVNVYQLYLITSNPLLTNNSGINWNAKITSSFDLLNKTAAIQINGRYTAPRIVPQGFVQPGPAIDVSFQKSFFNKTLDLTIRVSDIFDWQQFYIETRVPGVYQERTFKWETRRLFFTLNYNFGKLQMNKIAKKRPSGNGGGGEEIM